MSKQYNFGAGILFAVPTADATGAAIANATPVQFATLQDISFDVSFEEKLLYGSNQFPIDVARGKGKIALKAKNADISGAMLGDLIFGGGATAGIRAAVTDYTIVIPAAVAPALPAITVAPPGGGEFISDLGVIYAETGDALAKVAAAPATGQYSVDADGKYTFATAEIDTAIQLNYEYSATSTTASFGIISNRKMGYAPSFSAMLTMAHNGKSFNLVLNKCVSSQLAMAFKNDDFGIPDFTASAFADAQGNIGYWAIG